VNFFMVNPEIYSFLNLTSDVKGQLSSYCLLYLTLTMLQQVVKLSGNFT
jgi:hypothetical protein